jgi:hypothetical protein
MLVLPTYTGLTDFSWNNKPKWENIPKLATKNPKMAITYVYQNGTKKQMAQVYTNIFHRKFFHKYTCDDILV